MNWYPQCDSGSIAQFPLSRSRRWRSIVNQIESSELLMLPDTAAGQIEWKLSYQSLTDAEVQNFTNLFTASQGEFLPFGFIDPLANLLGWSEDLSRPDWQAGLLQTHGGVRDPVGTQRAWTVSNSSAGSQSVTQTVGIAGAYVACFSVYVRSNVIGTIALLRDSLEVTAPVGPSWNRVWVTGAGATGAAQSSFSIVVSAGQTIEVWGLQVEAQPYPSAYKQTLAALGIYEETYFGTDELTVTSSGPGLSSCNVTLLSRV